MDERVPTNLKVASGLQIVSGLINLLLTSWMSWIGVSCICSTLTLPFLTIGGFCGLASLLLIPLGLIEIGAGVYGALNPREAARIMRLLAFLEIASIVVGALPSAIVGMVVRWLLSTDDVLIYLEG